jgi:plastocyanin
MLSPGPSLLFAALPPVSRVPYRRSFVHGSGGGVGLPWGTVKLLAHTIKATALTGLIVLALPAVGRAGAEPATVELTMSNFHYCAGQTCSPADQGYVRQKSGPVAGTDNPAAIVDVPEGATVHWTYHDVGPGSCDFFQQCPGHNVRIEDGSADGARVGFVKARSGAGVITATINQPAGTLIRYFCSVNDHYQLGMTGILRVVPAGGGQAR